MENEKELSKKALEQIRMEQDEIANQTKPIPISYQEIDKINKNISEGVCIEDRKHLQVEGYSKLPTSPGICMFIDMVESTKMKALQSNGEWVMRYFNLFSYAKSFIPNSDPDHHHIYLKSTGDGVMVFMPELKGKTLLGSVLIEAARTILNDSSYFAELRASMHYCNDSYFLELPDPKHPDYYGLDVDITSRLNGEAKSQDLVISQTMLEKLDTTYLLHFWEYVGSCSKMLKGCIIKMDFHVYRIKKE